MWPLLNGPVYVFNEPVDLRKGFEGLMGLCTCVLKRNPLGGEVYAFISKTRRSAKCLYWDGTGICILHKKIAKGLFVALWKGNPSEPLHLTLSELALLMEGSQVVGRMPLSPPRIDVGEYDAHQPQNPRNT